MTNRLTVGLRGTAKECVLFSRSLLLAFILSSAILPPEWLYANPPNGNPRFLGKKDDLALTGDDHSQMDMMRERQRRRDIIMGIEPARLQSDPYLLEGQQVEVETWRRLKNGRGPRLGETLIVETVNGLEVKHAVSKVVYDYGHPNTSYTPPSSYVLGRDIKFEIAEEFFAAVYERPSLSGKIIYRHRFQAPGVVSVGKSDLAANVLFRNGDIRNIVMAHHRLFDVNQHTGGVPLPLALVDAVDATQLEPAPIASNMVLENYDWRLARNYQWDASISDEVRKNIRHGDDIYVERGATPGSGVVRRVLTLSATMEALQGHEDHFRLRQDLLSQERVFVSILQGMDQGTLLGQERPELLAAIANLDGAMGWMTNPALAQTMRRTQPQWQHSPVELPDLQSEILGQMARFSEHARTFAEETNKRSTYPVSKSPLADGSKEALEQAALNAYAAQVDEQREARDALMSASAKRWSKVLSSCTAPAVYATVLAAANAWIYLLPNSPFFLQTKLFDLGHGIEGPMVSYYIKFWLVGFSNLAFFFWVLPLSFAAMSERVLGRPTLKGLHVGLHQNLETGWEAFTTFGLNMASYLMMSLRQRLAAACSLVGIKTPGQCLLVMKHGLSPRSVIRKRFKWVSDLGKSAVGAMSVLWKRPQYDVADGDVDEDAEVPPQNLSENPLDTLVEADNNRIRARFIALYILVTKLGQRGLIQPGQSLTPGLLFRHLGEESFRRVQDRYLLVSSLIERALERGVGVGNGSVAEISEIMLSNREILESVDSPVGPLTGPEERLLRSIGHQSTLSKVWPRLAGNEYEFLRYRRATASQGSVDIVSDTFSTDCGTNPISMGLAPGDNAFASAANPGMLIASDRGLFGIVGHKPLTDNLFVNDIGWIAMITTDEKNYGDEHLLQTPFSMQNPQFTESDHNVTWVRLRSAKRATFFQTLRSWVTFTDPRGADFWEGLERFGERITVAQLKTWKPTAIVGMLGAMWGFASDLPASLAARGVAGFAVGLTSISLIKTFMQEAVGYLGYRPAWSWNSVGVTRSKTEVRSNTSELAGIVRDLASATARSKSEGESANLAPVEAQLVKLEAFYHRMGAEFPKSLREIPSVVDRADEMIMSAMLEPPMVTDRSEAAGRFSNISMGIATTIGQALVGALAWSASEGLSWGGCGLILGVTYTWGLILRSAGGNMRAKLSYGADIEALRTALEAFNILRSEENRQKLHGALAQAVLTYRRYGVADKLDGLMLDSVRRQDDVRVFGENLYLAMLENPPIDNKGSRGVIDRERATDFCAGLVAGAAAN